MPTKEAWRYASTEVSIFLIEDQASRNSPPSVSTRSQMSLCDVSDNVVKYDGMDGPNKRKRKRLSYRAPYEDVRPESPSITPSMIA